MDTDIIDQIAGLTAKQIGEVAMAVIDRYRELFPEWEIVFYSYPKEDKSLRELFIRSVLTLLEKTDHM